MYRPRHILTLTFLLLCLAATGARAQNHASWAGIKRTWKDLGLERQALHEANKHAAAMRCQEQYIYAKIVSDDWEVMANDDGIIVGRYIHMELYGETNDGQCGVAHCVFRQKRMGDETWSPRLRIVEVGGFYELECE